MEKTDTQPMPTRAPIYWSHEAITYLDLDRLGLARPDMAPQLLIKKGALRPKKIGSHLMFDKTDLDRVVANGDGVRRGGCLYPMCNESMHRVAGCFVCDCCAFNSCG